MVSTKEVRKSLYARLNTASVTSLLAAGSASLFHELAPQDAPFPFVIFNEQAETGQNLAFGGHQQERRIWQVRAVDRNTTSSTVEDIDAAIAARLHFGALTITGGQLVYIARESGVTYVETEGDEQFRYSGGLYRIDTQTAQ